MSLYEVIGRIGPPDCGRVGEFKLDLSDCPVKDRMLNRLISCPRSPGLVEASGWRGRVPRCRSLRGRSAAGAWLGLAAGERALM